MVIPLKAQFSNFIGYILCMWATIQDPDLNLLQLLLRVVFAAVYYKNIWESKNFPFVCIFFFLFPRLCSYSKQLSQELFNLNGTLYNQTLILNSNFEVDPTLLDEVGLVCHLFDLKMAYRQPLLGVALLCRILGRPTANCEPWVGCHIYPFTDLELQRYDSCLELDVAF